MREQGKQLDNWLSTVSDFIAVKFHTNHWILFLSGAESVWHWFELLYFQFINETFDASEIIIGTIFCLDKS